MAMIPFDDRDGQIWFDGRLIPWRQAQVPLLNHGLHYASCVFEGERVYEGKIFKSREHSERLQHSAEILDFSLPISIDALEAAKQEAIAAQNITNGYVRAVAWRGSERMGVSAQENTIHLAVATWEWPSYFSPEARMRGITLKTSSWKRPAPDTAPVAAKAAGLYMICTLSKHEAERHGYEDALMLDYRGYVAEGTGANFFMVVDGVLHTPTPDCFLNGITRQTVIELARQRGMEVIERHILPEDLKTAQEVFLTGTAAEVTPVGKIDDIVYHPGEVCRTLNEDYESLVRS